MLDRDPQHSAEGNKGRALTGTLEGRKVHVVSTLIYSRVSLRNLNKTEEKGDAGKEVGIKFVLNDQVTHKTSHRHHGKKHRRVVF